MPTPLIFRVPNIVGGQSISAPNLASVRFWQTRIYFIKSIATRRNTKMWKPGDVIAWRGIYRERVWHAQTTIVVRDSPEEVVLTLLPGTECIAPEGYLNGKDSNKRRWNFKDKDWEIQNYLWRTNRLLLLLESEKYYSVMHFWNHASNEFLCYYINFQLPFKRSAYSVDTLDLDLDIIVHPDLRVEWK